MAAIKMIASRASFRILISFIESLAGFHIALPVLEKTHRLRLFVSRHTGEGGTDEDAKIGLSRQHTSQAAQPISPIHVRIKLTINDKISLFGKINN
jgi:hypothetical protein